MQNKEFTVDDLSDEILEEIDILNTWWYLMGDDIRKRIECEMKKYYEK